VGNHDERILTIASPSLDKSIAKGENMKLGHIIVTNATKTVVESATETIVDSTDETTIWPNDDERDWFITGDDDEDHTSPPIEKTIEDHDKIIRSHSVEIRELKNFIKSGFQAILSRLDSLESAR
jgi:hypothetical protein